MADLAHQVAQVFIFDPMDGFAHGRCRWERSWTLYCMLIYTKIVYLARAMLGVLAGMCAVKAGRGGVRGSQRNEGPWVMQPARMRWAPGYLGIIGHRPAFRVKGGPKWTGI
jgi:hypothetical protein